jgi:hypothetical protein
MKNIDDFEKMISLLRNVVYMGHSLIKNEIIESEFTSYIAFIEETKDFIKKNTEDTYVLDKLKQIPQINYKQMKFRLVFSIFKNYSAINETLNYVKSVEEIFENLIFYYSHIFPLNSTTSSDIKQ